MQSPRRKNYVFAAAVIGAALVAAVILVTYKPPAQATSKPLRVVAESFSKIRVGEDAPFVSLAKAGVPPYKYEWDFGDGITSQMQNATHIYQQTGNYTITLTVTDSAGEIRDVSHRVTVYPPDANFTRADDILRY